MFYSVSKTKTGELPPHKCYRLLRLFPRTLHLFLAISTALLVVSQTLSSQTVTPESLFRRAVEEQKRGNNAGAVKCYEELLQLRPNAIEVRVNLGVALAHEKHYKEAIEQYRIVLVHDPSNRFARLNIVAAYHDDGDDKRATIELENMHQAHPRDDEISMMLADSYLQSGNYVNAFPLLSQLEIDNPDDSDLEEALGKVLVHLGQVENGVTRLETAAKMKSNANDFVLAGRVRFSMAQYDLAQHDGKAAAQLNRNAPGLDTLNGMILEQTSHYNDAEIVLSKAVSENPNDFNGNLYLGGVFYFKRDLAKAKLYLGRAIQIKPDSAQAHYELALVERAEGNLTGALAELRVAEHRMPNWLQPHVELAALLYRLHRSVEGAKEKAIVDKMVAVEQRSSISSPK